MSEIPYYPVVEKQSNPTFLSLKTVIRKRHEGKWYLWTVSRHSWVQPSEHLSEIEDFCIECYKALMFGVVQPELKAFKDGFLIFPEDPLQISEEERLLHK